MTHMQRGDSDPFVPQQPGPPGAAGGGSQWLGQWLAQPRAIPLDDPWYEKWTVLCVAGAVLTGFVAPFLMAFEGSEGLQ